jgi:hypothetical protein
MQTILRRSLNLNHCLILSHYLNRYLNRFH